MFLANKSLRNPSVSAGARGKLGRDICAARGGWRRGGQCSARRVSAVWELCRVWKWGPPLRAHSRSARPGGRIEETQELDFDQ